MMRVYLAGPMRGIPGLNKPAFMEAATWLRGEGHWVFNPGEETDSGKVTFSQCIRRDLETLMCPCDTLVLLPGWEKSQGASTEYMVARALGYPVYMYYTDDSSKYYPPKRLVTAEDDDIVETTVDGWCAAGYEDRC